MCGHCYFPDGVVHGQTERRMLPGLAGGHAADDSGAVGEGIGGIEACLALVLVLAGAGADLFACKPLVNDAGVWRRTKFLNVFDILADINSPNSSPLRGANQTTMQSSRGSSGLRLDSSQQPQRPRLTAHAAAHIKLASLSLRAWAHHRIYCQELGQTL
jgi:hypothetical protein